MQIQDTVNVEFESVLLTESFPFLEVGISTPNQHRPDFCFVIKTEKENQINIFF